MTSLTFQITATGSSLPTAWLAPPPGLLPSSQPVKIAPVPIAISATIALITGAYIIILLSRKDKEVFLEDKIVQVPEDQNAAPSDPGISTPFAVRIPEAIRHNLATTSSSRNQEPRQTQAQAPNFSRPHYASERATEWRPSGQKLDDVLGIKRNWETERNMPCRNPLSKYRSYYTPSPPRKAAYDSDDETLNDDERNSAYVPFPGSDLNLSVHGKETGGLGGLDSSHVSDDSSMDSVKAYGKTQLEFAKQYKFED